MNDPQATLTPEFVSTEPYGWLAGDDAYELPQDWLDHVPIAERQSVRILASYDQNGFARAGAFMGPVVSDPEYGILTMAEREFIGVVVSAANACPSCLIIHGHKLGQQIGDHGRARRIAINYRAVALSAQERAIADYCVKLTKWPGQMAAADIQDLRDVGLSDEKIYYVIELAGVYNLSNRMASGYGMRPADEFMSEIEPRA